MRARRGSTAGLAIALAGLVVVPLSLGAAPAEAAVGSSRPSAIALDSDGTSYVGFGSGDALSRLTKDGRRLSPLPLDQPGPVNGLAVDERDRVWVAYDGSVSALDARGAVLRHFVRSPGATCAHDADHRVTDYGGIAVDATRVYVADRCTAGLEVYGRESGALELRLPLASRGHGLAWQRPLDGKSARLFVAVPDRRSVLTYDLATLSATSRPVHTLAIKAPYRGKRPVPAGVSVDRQGSLTVSDAANHALYLFNTRQGYGLYRTLGHPATAGTADGYLNGPAAIAQHPQDRSGLAANLFVADTRNGRVQRWDSGGGYTFWVRALALPVPVDPVDPADPVDPVGPVDPVDPAGAPVATAPPTVTEVAGGGALFCNPGSWTGGTASYAYRWLRDGTVVPGADGSTYALAGADDGTEIACRVTATTTSGSASATSTGWFVGAAVPPASTSAPAIIGTPARGRTLTCTTGSWRATPAPRYSYVWLRGSVQVEAAPTHVVTVGDVGRSLSCTVIATNQAGSSSASSPSVVPTGGASTDPDPEPSTEPCSGRPRVLIAGGSARVGSSRVQLSIVTPADAGTIEVANDAAFATARTVHLTASCTAPWTLVAPSSDAVPTSVYVRWRGGTSAGVVVSDTVLLDRTGPVVSGARVRFSGHRWRLRVSASDVSALRSITYAPARTGIRRTVSYAAQVRVRVPEMARWVRVTDGFGNVGAWRRVR